MPTTEPSSERWLLHMMVVATAIFAASSIMVFDLPLCPSASGSGMTTPWAVVLFIVTIAVYIATFAALRLKSRWQQIKNATAGLSKRICFAMDGLLLAGLLGLIGLLLFSESAHAQFHGFCFDPS